MKARLTQVVFSRLNQSIANSEHPLNVDAWDGYLANKNRTLQTLYDNQIGNNIMIAGDSHANWVSDVAWVDNKPYDPKTGAGAIGVEFAGTALSSPSPYGQNITIADANKASKALVADNEELHWSELYYRGYFELHITRKEVEARFFGLPNIKERNADEISLANFTVKSGANHLERNSNGAVGGGAVSNGWLKNGQLVPTNQKNNTATGTYSVYGQ